MVSFHLAIIQSLIILEDAVVITTYFCFYSDEESFPLSGTCSCLSFLHCMVAIPNAFLAAGGMNTIAAQV